MLKVDAVLGSRASGLTHILMVVVEGASQVHCSQGMCLGTDDGGVKSMKMVAYCLSVMPHARSLLYKQIVLGQPNLKWPSQSVNFISQVTSCVRLWEEEPQTAFPMPLTWASHIATSMLMGR